MQIGTRSLLFGAHHFLLHPLCVALAWKRLYGRWPRGWESICIFLHDWGYWGCPNLDGKEGTDHPRLGAALASWIISKLYGEGVGRYAREFCEGHSRHYAIRHLKGETSRLMAADKLGAVIPPWWVYLPMAWVTGELAEYRAESDRYQKETGKGISLDASSRAWYSWLRTHMAHAAQTGKVGAFRG